MTIRISVLISFSLTAVLLGSTSALAQYDYEGDPVVVDRKVLERLGPDPDLPALVRPGRRAPERGTVTLRKPGAAQAAPKAAKPQAETKPEPQPAPEPAKTADPAPEPARTAEPAPAAEPPPEPVKSPEPVKTAEPVKTVEPEPVPVAPPPAAKPEPSVPTLAQQPPAPKPEVPPAHPPLDTRLVGVLTEAERPGLDIPTAPPAGSHKTLSKPIDGPAPATVAVAAPPSAKPPAKPPAGDVAAVTVRPPNGGLVPPPVRTPPAVHTPPPPAPAVAAPAAPVQPATSRGGGIVRRDDGSVRLLFASNESILPDGSAPVLEGLAQRMEEDPHLYLQLLAYAEGTEDEASKARRLSLSRALAIRSYLMNYGVRSTRIEVRALGNKVPDGPADRVDLVLDKR